MKCIKNSLVRCITVILYITVLFIASFHFHSISLRNGLSWDVSDSSINKHDTLSCGILHLQKELSSFTPLLAILVAIFFFFIIAFVLRYSTLASSTTFHKPKRAPPFSFA